MQNDYMTAKKVAGGVAQAGQTGGSNLETADVRSGKSLN